MSKASPVRLQISLGFMIMTEKNMPFVCFYNSMQDKKTVDVCFPNLDSFKNFIEKHPELKCEYWGTLEDIPEDTLKGGDSEKFFELLKAELQNTKNMQQEEKKNV